MDMFTKVIALEIYLVRSPFLALRLLGDMPVKMYVPFAGLIWPEDYKFIIDDVGNAVNTSVKAALQDAECISKRFEKMVDHILTDY